MTAVGGTATAIDATGRLAWETGWGTYRYALAPDGTAWSSSGTFLYGSGGGESTVFAQPIYQQGITPAGARGVPDVAMDADVTTGMLVGQTQAFPDGTYYDQYRIGGTSLAAPLFAGMTALTFQHARGGVGLLNPTIYRNAGTGVFTDVTGPGPDPGNVRVDYADGVDAAQGVVATVRTFNQDSSLAVGPGWDPVTGLGSANAGWLTAIPRGHGDNGDQPEGGRGLSRTQHPPGRGSTTASSSLMPRPSSRPVTNDWFIAQTVSASASTSAWNGQLANA